MFCMDLAFVVNSPLPSRQGSMRRLFPVESWGGPAVEVFLAWLARMKNDGAMSGGEGLDDFHDSTGVVDKVIGMTSLRHTWYEQAPSLTAHARLVQPLCPVIWFINLIPTLVRFSFTQAKPKSVRTFNSTVRSTLLEWDNP